MAAQLRLLRRRIRSVQSTKKITRAQELIAASRIARAQAAVAAAAPYADEITRVVRAIAATSGVSSPMTRERENPARAAVIVVNSDRGFAGAYNANAVRAAAELLRTLEQEGKEVALFAIGRKAVGYYTFRGRKPVAAFTGFSEQPAYADAKRAADAAIEAFVAGSGNQVKLEGPTWEGTPADGLAFEGVDEIHLVYTEYKSALTQQPTVVRLLPLTEQQAAEEDTADSEDAGQQAAYEFEPNAESVLDELLPRYVESRLYASLLSSAASESANRRRAMKAATDNADELVKALTREANSARQAEITQEISEIVGGADALSSSVEA